MLVRAKMACSQYAIPTAVCEAIFTLLQSGPIPTITLRNYLAPQLPSSFKVDSTFIFNFKMKMKRLEIKYCNKGGVPLAELRKIFHPKSLEEAPEFWYNDPCMEAIFRDAMMEVMEERVDGKTKIFVVMEKVKRAVASGYDYRIYYSDDGRPTGVLQMTPNQMHKFRRYGTVFSFDAQMKFKNTFGWVYVSFSGTNMSNVLDNFFLGWTDVIIHSAPES